MSEYPGTVAAVYFLRDGKIVTEAPSAANTMTSGTDETWTDEHGTVWTRPTAWAYAQACRALHEKQAHLSALLLAGEPILNWPAQDFDGKSYRTIPADLFNSFAAALEKAQSQTRKRGVADPSA